MNKMPMAEVDKLCKMIPTLPVGMKITKALEVNPEFKAAVNSSPLAKELIETALRLEGLTRHDSVPRRRCGYLRRAIGGQHPRAAGR